MSTTYQDLQFTTFPEQIQTFITMLDMIAADGPAIKGYQQAMQDGDYATAQQYFSQIQNGNQKFIDAEKINTLIDTCVALERFYQSDIEPYINNLQNDWENTIDQFSYKGNWDASVTYYKNNFVGAIVNGVYNLYLLTADSARNIPVTNINYWRQLTIRGEQGESGGTLSFRFEWSSAETYYVGDVVSYNDGLWSCLAENQNIPPVLNSNYWELIYQSSQYIYPFSSTQPTGATTGGLWFQKLS